MGSVYNLSEDVELGVGRPKSGRKSPLPRIALARAEFNAYSEP